MASYRARIGARTQSLHGVRPLSVRRRRSTGAWQRGLRIALQPCILGTLVDTMRTTPRSDTGWRWCPAKRDRQPSLCACVLLAAREATVAPHAKGYKKHPPPMAMWTQSGCAFRIRLESSPRQDRPNRLDNYGIFELDHNTIMRAYTFPGNLSMLGHPMELIGECNASCMPYWRTCFVTLLLCIAKDIPAINTQMFIRMVGHAVSHAVPVS